MVGLPTVYHKRMRIRNFKSQQLDIEEFHSSKTTLYVASISWWVYQLPIINECVHKISCPCYLPLRRFLVRSRSSQQHQVTFMINMHYHRFWISMQNFISIGYREVGQIKLERFVNIQVKLNKSF